MDARERLAVHESGHVVVGLEEMFGIEWVSIEVGPARDGFTRVVRPPGWGGVTSGRRNWTRPADLSDPQQRLWIGPAVRRMLAGDLAEALLMGDCTWLGRDDWLQMEGLVGMVGLAGEDREVVIVGQI